MAIHRPPVYRKTKTGETVIYGPADRVRVGQVLTADSPHGGRLNPETVVELGEPFTVDGVQMVYGYLRPRSQRQTTAKRTTRTRPRGSGCVTFGNCSSFGDGSSCGADDCDGWLPPPDES